MMFYGIWTDRLSLLQRSCSSISKLQKARESFGTLQLTSWERLQKDIMAAIYALVLPQMKASSTRWEWARAKNPEGESWPYDAKDPETRRRKCHQNRYSEILSLALLTFELFTLVTTHFQCCPSRRLYCFRDHRQVCYQGQATIR